jgi:hypothetical protein
LGSLPKHSNSVAKEFGIDQIGKAVDARWAGMRFDVFSGELSRHCELVETSKDNSAQQAGTSAMMLNGCKM